MRLSNLIQIPYKGGNLVLVPTSSVSLLTTQLNITNNQDLQSAIPYALEDEVVQNVADLHFSWVRDPNSSDIHVVVATHEIMQLLQQRDIDSDTIVQPDVLALPITKDVWSVVIYGDRALVRTDLFEGFECKRDMLEQQIKLYLRNHPIPKKIHYWYHSDDTNDWLPDTVKPITHYTPFKNYRSWIKSNAMPLPGLNLLSGSYQIKQTNEFKLGKWLPAITLVLLTLLIHFGYSWAQIFYLESKQRALVEQSNQLFSESFPQIKKIVKPKFQAEQELKKLGVRQTDSSNEFFNIYGNVIKNIEAYPDIRLLGFTWKNDRFDYQLEANSMTSIEGFNRKLIELGIDSEVFNFVNDNGKAKSKLRVQVN